MTATEERCCADGGCRERDNHIRIPMGRPRRGSGFYLQSGWGGDRALCGDDMTCRDLTHAQTRFESKRQLVDCAACIELRTAQ